MMRRQKQDGNHFPPNNKLVEEPEGDQENRCPDPYSNKTKLTVPKNPMNPIRTP
jgi:hypothetical protein